MGQVNPVYDVLVTFDVRVELNRAAFTEQFMSEFRDDFYPFHELSDHAGHIAQLVAREVIDPIGYRCGQDQFVEGYGVIGPFVIKAEITGGEQDVMTEDGNARD